MKILVTGASGFIGSAFTKAAVDAGHQVGPLGRRPPSGGVPWDPDAGTLDPARLEGFDAVVHLAGESIAAGRWTAARKKRILDSRVRGTELLCSALASLQSRPKVLLSASAIGFYGDCGDRRLDERSPAGSDFLAQVCRAWEAATRSAADAGIRVVHLRTGIVLSKRGGALSKMLLPFKLGVGGRIGSGQQYMSWIHLEDELGAMLHCLNREALSGPVNLVGPAPATNAEFTKALGRALGRPTVFPLPAFAARAMLGEMADALLLSSQRVEPARLVADGYVFRHRDLDGTLRSVLA